MRKPILLVCLALLTPIVVEGQLRHEVLRSVSVEGPASIVVYSNWARAGTDHLPLVEIFVDTEQTNSSDIRVEYLELEDDGTPGNKIVHEVRVQPGRTRVHMIRQLRGYHAVRVVAEGGDAAAIRIAIVGSS